MKRPVMLLLVVVALAVGAYFLFFNKAKVDRGPKDQPLTQEANSGPFNQSYSMLLTAYLDIKEGLFKDDTVAINKAAIALQVAADSLKVNDLKADSLIKETAKNYAATISGSAKGLLGEADIDAKRKEFEMITNVLYDLTRTVKYDGKKIYYQYCPMAFNNKGAYWLSGEREIKNPYFGAKMPDCGSLEDSLDFSQKK